MSTRPDVKDFVTEAWDELYSDSFARGAYIPRSQNICATIGCESIEPAESLCAGCKKQFYCSAACQKSYVYAEIQLGLKPATEVVQYRDWKSHKPHCQWKRK